jgi:hypothetical protein
LGQGAQLFAHIDASRVVLTESAELAEAVEQQLLYFVRPEKQLVTNTRIQETIHFGTMRGDILGWLSELLAAVYLPAVAGGCLVPSSMQKELAGAHEMSQQAPKLWSAWVRNGAPHPKSSWASKLKQMGQLCPIRHAEKEKEIWRPQIGSSFQ